ncbi:MAG: ATP-binding protein [Pleurocapsa sp. MO_192.B19]|nr:ATP-binding protein [Pleurocapsa sp. MO_192.B19]
MNTFPISHWHQENLATLILATEYIGQCLKNKLEDKASQPLPHDAILPTSALATLCRMFYLTEFERDILLLSTAFEIDPTIAQLCGKLQGNPQLNYPTFTLALTTFPQASWSVLSPQNPLQSWRLIEFGTGFSLTQAPLRIDRRILSYLLGEDAFDERLLGFVYPLPPHLEENTLTYSQKEIVEQLVSIWSNYSSSSPSIQLCGEEITAKYAIAQATSVFLGYNFKIVSASIFTQSPDEIYQIKQRWEREALLSNSLLFLDCDDILANEPRVAFQVSQFVKHLQTPVILSSKQKLNIKHARIIFFDVPPLSYQEQTKIWANYLGTEAKQINGQISQLVSQFNLSNVAIQAVCQQFKIQNSKLKAEKENYSALSQPRLGDISQKKNSDLYLLWDFCRHQARPQLDNLAQRIDISATWNDLVLPEQQCQILYDIATHLRQRAKVYQEWGFASKGSRGLGISALFHGDSGTGKTMAAEVLANQFRLDLYRIDLSAVVSKYIGETEKNLRRIFDAAETGGVILLFDEADALFGKRTEVQDSHDRHANVEVSYLLQRIESYQGLAILTTNHKNALDSAFLRRIRFFVEFSLPDAVLRTEIWQRVFPQATPTQGLDYQKLGQLKIAGGNIRNIALNAAFLAADADESVMMKHILQATKQEYLKLKRLLTDEEIRDWN